MSNTEVHPHLERLYLAAMERQLIKERAPGALARLFNQSPQTVTNWRTRGLSARALLDVQQAAGINATWIETGVGSPSLSTPYSTTGATTELRAREPDTLPSERRRRIDAVLELAETLDDYGLVALLEKAKDLARDYPARKQQAS